MFLKILENYPGYSQNFPWKFSRFLLEILWMFNGNYLIFSLKCFPNTLEFHFSNFVFTVQPETCHLSITSYVNNNRQSEGLTSCLHSLYVETFSYFVNVKNQVRRIVLFCEKKTVCICFICKTEWEKHQENVFVLWKKKQNISKIFFSVKNKRKEQFQECVLGQGDLLFPDKSPPKKK